MTSTTSADVVQSAQDFYGRWDTLDHEQKRSVIDAVVETVVIGEREIETHLHYASSPPSSDDGGTMQKALSLFAFFPHARAVFRDHNPEHADIPPKGLPRLLFQRRRALGLTKRETAKRLGVHVEMVGKWERGEHHPRAMHYPAIIAFLGDDSWVTAATSAERIKRFRLLRGWSQKRLGEELGCSPRAVHRWESGQSPPPLMQKLVSDHPGHWADTRSKTDTARQRGE